MRMLIGMFISNLVKMCKVVKYITLKKLRKYLKSTYLLHKIRHYGQRNTFQ